MKRRTAPDVPTIPLDLADVLSGTHRDYYMREALKAQGVIYNPLLLRYTLSPEAIEQLRGEHRAALEARTAEQGIDWERATFAARTAREAEWRRRIQKWDGPGGAGSPLWWAFRRQLGIPDDFAPETTA